MKRLRNLTLPQRLALVLTGCAVAAAIAGAVADRSPSTAAEVAREVEGLGEDPFAYREGQADEFVERASRGLEHPIYEFSPDGVEATAERVDSFREEVEAAADAEEVEADTLEAVVFLESAGRADAIAGPTPESASGLAQMLPGTAEDFLDMSVDLERSVALTAEIGRLAERAESTESAETADRTEKQVAELEAERARVDERFDPEAALAGAARYLTLVQDTFGREDLATASYHMGVGNLESVISTYVSPERLEGETAATVAEHDLSYARLYFDSTPLDNAATHAALAELGDDSRHYLFRIEAARVIMDLYRDDPEELRRRVELHAGESSSEDVLRPPEETEQFADPRDLEEAYDDHELIRLERDPDRLGYEIQLELGDLAQGLGVDRSLYRGLRPEALAVLLYAADRVREIAGRPATLPVVGAVYDATYRDRLNSVDGGDSSSTTGYAFEIDTGDMTPEESDAIDAVLTRLTALQVTAASEAGGIYRVTVGPRGGELLSG